MEILIRLTPEEWEKRRILKAIANKPSLPTGSKFQLQGRNPLAVENTRLEVEKWNRMTEKLKLERQAVEEEQRLKAAWTRSEIGGVAVYTRPRSADVAEELRSIPSSIMGKVMRFVLGG